MWPDFDAEVWWNGSLEIGCWSLVIASILPLRWLDRVFIDVEKKEKIELKKMHNFSFRSYKTLVVDIDRQFCNPLDANWLNPWM